ncbi:two-component system response regulator [Vibrio sp. HA2012]|uniref:response regulator n=1 Tax=Vibrio sp. HA2012 TaxID=1971595 RepID=UPI000C2B96AA|nr:response regulator [Vibrio sp. HA2012]PJC88319.1 two-component system response regulator [Vibrio sp. HA2012]
MVDSCSNSVLDTQAGNGEKQVIMLVDDDPVFRRFISVLLEKEGYQVIQAEHGLEALQKLRLQVPDLILCDLSMPILNGIEFAEEVCWEYPSIPMIVVSATEDMSDVARALRFGIKDFLSKPISVPDHLTSAISNILKDERKHTELSRDFASQWLRVGERGDIPEDKELHWHLRFLEQNSGAARELLLALLPDRDTRQGEWHCSYNLLQSSDAMPLVFDYAWLMDGQFAFYIVDAESAEDRSVATSLLVRAIFNDALRRAEIPLNNLVEFTGVVEKGMECLDCTKPTNALFGIMDTTDASVSVFSTGLDAIWSYHDTYGHFTHKIAAGCQLGCGCYKNPVENRLPVGSGGKLTLANIGISHFSLEILPKRSD